MDTHTESLVATGVSLGVLHVLAGPDHLSALAALSVGNSWRAFSLGFRWGLGHSTGLIVVAIIFILMKGDLDLKLLGRYCDSLVGAFMIILGAYGVLSAMRDRRDKAKKSDDDLNESRPLLAVVAPTDASSGNSNSSITGGSTYNKTEEVGVVYPTQSIRVTDISLRDRNPGAHAQSSASSTHSSNGTSSSSHSSSASATALLLRDHAHSEIDEDNAARGHGGSLVSHLELGLSPDSRPPSSRTPRNFYADDDDDDPSSSPVHYKSSARSSVSGHHEDVDFEGLERDCWVLGWVDMRDPMVQRIVSFSIGLLHGVAGPGGILGVLPAVEMRSWRSSTLYLGSFVVASTLSMGCFAALYGEVTKRLGATQQCVDLALRLFSSAMSIVVGVLWCVLSVFGEKDKYFH